MFFFFYFIFISDRRPTNRGLNAFHSTGHYRTPILQRMTFESQLIIDRIEAGPTVCLDLLAPGTPPRVLQHRLGHVVVRGHLVLEAAGKVLRQIGKILPGGHGCRGGSIVAGQQLGGGGVMGVADIAPRPNTLMVGQGQWRHRLLVVRMLSLSLSLARLWLLLVVLQVRVLLVVVRMLRRGMVFGGVMLHRSRMMILPRTRTSTRTRSRSSSSCCPRRRCRSSGWRRRQGRGRGMAHGSFARCRRRCGCCRCHMVVRVVVMVVVAEVAAMVGGGSGGGGRVLQLGALQVEDVRYVEAGALRGRHLGVEQAARTKDMR